MGAFTCPDPGEMYLWALLLLVIGLAGCLIAISEAITSHEPGWAIWFVIMAVLCAGFYFRVVAWWLAWMRSGVTRPDD